MESLADIGSFEDPDEAPYFEPYLQPLSEKDLDGAVTHPDTGIITRAGKGIGIRINGQPVRGFKTPSRKFEVISEYSQRMGQSADVSDLIARANSKGRQRPDSHKQYTLDIKPGPHYMQIEEHKNLKDDEFVMTSFKWNVHNHGRTANLKWCAEIVHSNPAWIHPEAAAKLDLEDGDWIEVHGYRSTTLDRAMPTLKLGDGEIDGVLRIPVVLTRGVHPRAIAISNSLGHDQYSDVAQARRDGPGDEAAGMNPGLKDDDWQRNMWWEDSSNGEPAKWKKNSGPGWAQNHVMPIAPDPISGQQSFNDTVIRVRKVT